MTDTLAAPAAATVTSVTSEPDPHRPGRTVHLIEGATAAVVQDAIDTLMRTVDTAFGGVCGRASFVGPTRSRGQWIARGEVVVDQPGVF